MFVPIPSKWKANTSAVPEGGLGRNGSSLSGRKEIERFRRHESHCPEFETGAIASHLFWTWFVDNPRPTSTRRS